MCLWGPSASLKKHGFLIYNDICALNSDAGLSEACVLDGFILLAQGHVAVERELPCIRLDLCFGGVSTGFTSMTAWFGTADWLNAEKEGGGKSYLIKYCSYLICWKRTKLLWI